MPIHKVKLPDGSMGYQWGRTGKKYKDLEDARRQERAIYASGWREEGESKKANAKGVCGMNYKEWLQKQASGTNLINLYQGGRGLLTAGGAAADALTLAALLHGATTGNRATGTIGGAILGSGIGSGLLGGTAKAIASAGNNVGAPVAAGVVGSTVGGLGGLIGGGTIGYILSNAAKKRREKLERLEREDETKSKVSGKPAAKTASKGSGALEPDGGEDKKPNLVDPAEHKETSNQNKSTQSVFDPPNKDFALIQAAYDRLKAEKDARNSKLRLGSGLVGLGGAAAGVAAKKPLLAALGGAVAGGTAGYEFGRRTNYTAADPAIGSMAGALGVGSLSYILANRKTANSKTAQLKNAESAVQLPKAIQPTGVTGPTMTKTYPSMPKAYKPMPTVPKATAQPVAPAKAPAAIKSPAAAKPAYQQEPDLGGTRTVHPGDTAWQYWKDLGGNLHMPWNEWIKEFQASNPGIDINKLMPGTVVGLGRGVE